ncbi:MAG: DUF3565 domain-containing protein [Pyrinomonadaceae bacterium]
MKRRIIEFNLDEHHDWRAVLECGHLQHVRHDPPLIQRPWVLTPEGRAQYVGLDLDCKLCDRADDADPKVT